MLRRTDSSSLLSANSISDFSAAMSSSLAPLAAIAASCFSSSTGSTVKRKNASVGGSKAISSRLHRLFTPRLPIPFQGRLNESMFSITGVSDLGIRYGTVRAADRRALLSQ